MLHYGKQVDLWRKARILHWRQACPTLSVPLFADFYKFWSFNCLFLIFVLLQLLNANRLLMTSIFTRYTKCLGKRASIIIHLQCLRRRVSVSELSGGRTSLVVLPMKDLVVKTVLPMKRVWVPSLVGELSSHMLHGVVINKCVLVAQSCPTLCDPMDQSPLESSIHGILQARILEWVAISFST